MKKYRNVEGKVISSRVPENVYVSMQELADSKGLSLSAYICLILSRGIEKKKGQTENVYVSVYNPKIHKAGDRVMVQKGKKMVEVEVPEVDADGNIF